MKFKKEYRFEQGMTSVTVEHKRASTSETMHSIQEELAIHNWSILSTSDLEVMTLLQCVLPQSGNPSKCGGQPIKWQLAKLIEASVKNNPTIAYKSFENYKYATSDIALDVALADKYHIYMYSINENKQFVALTDTNAEKAELLLFKLKEKNELDAEELSYIDKTIMRINQIIAKRYFYFTFKQKDPIDPHRTIQYECTKTHNQYIKINDETSFVKYIVEQIKEINNTIQFFEAKEIDTLTSKTATYSSDTVAVKTIQISK